MQALIDDVTEEHCNIKQRTADDGDHVDARVTPAPRRCIQARNGAVEMQEAHRMGCSNEQCIAAFQIHGCLATGMQPATNGCSDTSLANQKVMRSATKKRRGFRVQLSCPNDLRSAIDVIINTAAHLRAENMHKLQTLGVIACGVAKQTATTANALRPTQPPPTPSNQSICSS